MIRLTARQFRTPAIVAGVALVALALLAGASGPSLAHLYRTTVASCAAHGNCDAARTALLRNDRTVRTWLDFFVSVVPGVIGVFWGAPLVARELESGTFRLAWTQSVTRTRWLAVKLAVVGATAMAVVALLSLIVTWWATPLDKAGMNQFATFGQRGLVPVGYAAFAFALGVTVGIVVRRPLPAMTVTLVTVVAVQIVGASLVRPHLLSPSQQASALDPVSTGYGSSASGISGLAFLFGHHLSDNLQPDVAAIPNTWTYSTRIVDRAGLALSSQTLQRICPGIGSGAPGGPGGSGAPGLGGGSSRQEVPAAVQQALHDCVARVGHTYHVVVTYLPASRYWPLQWYELAVYLAGALVVAAIGVWWVRRRLT